MSESIAYYGRNVVSSQKLACMWMAKKHAAGAIYI
jgi:hypothetical protein